MASPEYLSLLPIVNIPRRARPGSQYLITVDLQHDLTWNAWPFQSEHLALTCLLDARRSPSSSDPVSVASKSLFSHEAVGQTTLIVHRFGGTYGPVRFLLTACTEEATGSIGLSFIDERGMLVHELRIEEVAVESRQPLADVKEVHLPMSRLIPRAQPRSLPTARVSAVSGKLRPEESPQTQASRATTKSEVEPPKPPPRLIYKKPPPPPRPKTSVRPSSNPPPERTELGPEATEWYVGINDQPVGPMGIKELRERAAHGAIAPDSWVWCADFEHWQRLRRVPELAAILLLLDQLAPLTSAERKPEVLDEQTTVVQIPASALSDLPPPATDEAVRHAASNILGSSVPFVCSNCRASTGSHLA